MPGPLRALRARLPKRRRLASEYGSQALRRPAPKRAPAFVALGIGLVAVLLVVFVGQRGHGAWSPVGAPKIVDSVPDETAIAIFAMRIDKGRMAIVGVSRGAGTRCLSIQFSVDGQPGRSAPVLGEDCRPTEISGRGISIADDRGVRVYASGKLLHDVSAAELDGCGTDRNICALAFDRHGERLPLKTRKREEGEQDRDDLLLTMLRTGGRATESAEATRETPREAYFGDVTAELWNVRTEISGSAKPTPAQAIGALLTRRPKGFAVQVDDTRIGGSTRSLVIGGDGAFVED